MKVSEALDTRKTCRSFLPKAVPKETIEEILRLSMRAPSGGNLQPWRCYAIAGDVLESLIDATRPKLNLLPKGEGAEYNIYPPELHEPYRSRRFDLGEKLYKMLDIPREDKMARLMWFARNWEFFGAKTALLFSMDRKMQEGQWADLGMFMQSIMLLAREYGLHTAPQEAWAMFTPTVLSVIDIPEDHMLFCGMAIGWEDTSYKLSKFRSPRAPLEEISSFHGFQE